MTQNCVQKNGIISSSIPILFDLKSKITFRKLLKKKDF